MRLHEIAAPTDPVTQMLLKLRKGMAASLNAVRFQELGLPGWKIERTKFRKPSSGGWLLKDIPGGDMVPSYVRSTDGRVHCKAQVLADRGSDSYEMAGREHDQHSVDYVRTTIYPELVALAKHPKTRRWTIVDPRIAEYVEKHFKVVDVSYELIAECSGYLITAPDGQTYEVFGDHKNGALNPQTFEMFFRWAVENTSIMDQILNRLGMEPHEKKVDPRAPYVPPKTASAETLRVFALLKSMTDDIRVKQKASLIAWTTRLVNAFAAARQAGETKKADAMAEHDPVVFMQVWDSAKKTLKPDWPTIVERLSEESVEAMQNMFVRKNTNKLASIVTAKGNLASEDVLSVDADRGVITAMLRFGFADGASFRVDQSIVMSHARDRWGGLTWFYRFPTTFHDVIMPDGSKMGYPSEERMNEVFAKS